MLGSDRRDSSIDVGDDMITPVGSGVICSGGTGADGFLQQKNMICNLSGSIVCPLFIFGFNESDTILNNSL